MPEATVSESFDQVISSYVERGIFRNMKETVDGSAHVYRFAWLSEFHRIELVYDPQARTLGFVRLFPEAPEDVMRHLEDKVTQRSDPDSKVPAHRRIEPAVGVPSLVREEADASLRLDVGPDADAAQALQILVKLANDLIFDLQLRHPDYTYNHFAQSNE